MRKGTRVRPFEVGWVVCCGSAHVADDVVAELRALAEGRTLHQSLEVVCYRFCTDCAVHALDDEVCGFGPAHEAEHHFAGEDDGAGVDFVLVGVFGGGAVGCFEDGVSGVVVDVGSGCDADAADACGECVGDVVAVEVHGGDDVVFGGACEELLEEGVGDDVLDGDGLAGVGVGHGAPGAAVEELCAEVLACDLVAPFHEGTLGELHDVALVDEGDGVAVVVDGVLDCGLDESFGALLGDGLDAEAGGFGEADLLVAFWEVFLHELAELLVVIGALFELDACVDVLGVLAEDDHVGEVGSLDGGGDALEPADGAEAGVEVEDLAECDVE